MVKKGGIGPVALNYNVVAPHILSLAFVIYRVFIIVLVKKLNSFVNLCNIIE